jgi:hypothetical protein
MARRFCAISLSQWCERLQNEHAQMRHEVPGYAVIGVIWKDFHTLANGQP